MPPAGRGGRPDACERRPRGRLADEDELHHLPRPLRTQLALDRAVRAQTTPWHLAQDYERYVAYLRSSAGYAVTWRRSQGLERDLVARLDGTIEIVHCARAVPPRAVDDRRVGRLHAAVVATRLESRGRQVTGTLVTTTVLSTQARALAEALQLYVREEMPHRSGRGSSAPRASAGDAGPTPFRSTPATTTRPSTSPGASCSPCPSPRPRSAASAARRRASPEQRRPENRFQCETYQAHI